MIKGVSSILDKIVEIKKWKSEYLMSLDYKKVNLKKLKNFVPKI